MAATATTTETTHDDATSTSMASTEGFDELFVQPVDTPDQGRDLPTLPGGWRHAGLVGRIARQPRERRETILAGLFALVAGVWAPLGVLAFMTRNFLLFFGLTAVAVALGAAPRPASASQVVAGLGDRIRPALEGVGSALERVGPALERVGPALAAGRARLHPLASRLGAAAQRAAAAVRNGGHALRERLELVRDRLRSADRRVSAAVRQRLEDLRSGGPDHSTPSSAR